MAAPFDHTRFAQIAGLLASGHAGERDNALALANKMLTAARLTWADVLGGSGGAANGVENELTVARDAVRLLLGENRQLRTENRRLTDELALAGDQAAWSGAGGRHQAVAGWALSLLLDDQVHLSAREIDFLRQVERWTGSLTPAQQRWFGDLIPRIAQLTGQHPPS
jgi:hypothetical protein